MFYTPKYCGECSGEIEQVSWKFWTNHRFCENCKDNFRWQKWLPAIWISAGLLGIIYGFGVYLRKPEKPLNLVTSVDSSSADKNKNLRSQANSQNPAVIQPTAQKTEANEVSGQTNSVILNSAAGQKTLAASQNLDENKQNQPTEAVYICGAQTKKGTACLRRVKGGGRCWQHLGQPAMLPSEKLLLSR